MSASPADRVGPPAGSGGVGLPAGSDPAEGVRLADLTTFRLGGPARRTVVARTEDELVAAVAAADAAGEPVLLVGGGSNLLVADEGFDGVAVLVRTRGVELLSGDWCGGAFLRVAAGEDWDELVARTVAEDQAGIEALSGIPGTVGATPVQNVGAYGQSVADTIAEVRTWDRRDGRVRTIPGPSCGFGYRTSRFKEEPGRSVVLSVTFQLPVSERSTPVAYPELARALGVQLGERADLGAVRDAVLALRRGKGMVLDAADPDSWSAGSFFTNPVLDAAAAAALPPDAPRYPAPGGAVKTSAAWLVERAGFARGHGLPGAASLSTRHALALTNRGAATTEDVLRLAREVRDGVSARFGVELVPEPTLVGCTV